MVNKTLFFLILFAALLIALVWAFTQLFIYLFIALVLAAVLRPFTNLVSRIYIFQLKMPHIVAVFMSFVVFLGVIFSFVLLFIPLIIDQVNILSGLDFAKIYADLSQPIASLEDTLVKYHLLKPSEANLTETIYNHVFTFFKDLDFQNLLNQLLSFTGGFFVSVLSVSFMTFFLLYENGLFTRKLIAIVPNQYFELFVSAIHKIEHLLSNYLIGLSLQMLAIFSIAALGLSIFGIKYALTIAVFAAVANLIPYLGPLLGATFGLIVGLSTHGSLAFDQATTFLALKIMAVFAVVQTTDNLLLQPVIFSKSVKAHPLEIFVVIFASASLAGIMGMILAIPAYTILRVSAMEIHAGFSSYKIFQLSK